jgi:Rrf2 family transcriptional regulator, nitric oxide-sensitive transcriptional repressor
MVTRAADYALRATLALAGLPPGARVCLSELAAQCDVPPSYLYKVLQSLARGGLLAAHRGVTGGYELTPGAREASVLDIVEAVNGLPLLNTCVLSGGCHRAPACPAHPVWHEAQERMREVLAGARLADLSASRRAALPPAGPPARRPRTIQVLRERPCAEHGIRQPGRASRRPRPTYPKRMEDR